MMGDDERSGDDEGLDFDVSWAQKEATQKQDPLNPLPLESSTPPPTPSSSATFIKSIDLSYLLDTLRANPDELKPQEALILAAAMPPDFSDFYARVAQAAKPFLKEPPTPADVFQLYIRQNPDAPLPEKMEAIDMGLETLLGKLPILPLGLAKLHLTPYFLPEKDRENAWTLSLQKLFKPEGMLAKPLYKLELPEALLEHSGKIAKGLKEIKTLITPTSSNLAMIVVQQIIPGTFETDLRTQFEHIPKDPEDLDQYISRLVTYLKDYEQKILPLRDEKLKLLEERLKKLESESAPLKDEEFYMKTARYMQTNIDLAKLSAIQNPNEEQKAQLASLQRERDKLGLVTMIIPQLRNDAETLVTTLASLRQSAVLIYGYVSSHLPQLDWEASGDKTHQDTAAALQKQLVDKAGVADRGTFALFDAKRTLYQNLLRGTPLTPEQVYGSVAGELENYVGTTRAKTEARKILDKSLSDLAQVRRELGDENRRIRTDYDERLSRQLVTHQALQGQATHRIGLLEEKLRALGSRFREIHSNNRLLSTHLASAENHCQVYSDLFKRQPVLTRLLTLADAVLTEVKHYWHAEEYEPWYERRKKMKDGEQ